MGTTTKMAIPYPASTDLVKDGATAMQSLATQVDAKSGLVLLNTTSFSAVSSQSINDVFSTNYTNYRIVTSFTGTLQGDLYLRLRVSSTDNTSNNYYFAKMGYAYNNAAVNFGPNALSSYFIVGGTNGSGMSSVDITVYEPFTALNTGFTSNWQTRVDGANVFASGANGGQMSVTTSYTGFSLVPASGSITGSVSVFGFNK